MINATNQTILKDRIDNLKIQSEIVDKLVDEIVSKYCSELDTLMNNVYDILNDETVSISDEEYERIALRIPCLLYFLSTGQENTGIKQDISKIMEKEKYNRIYTASKGTIAERQAIATNETQIETILSTAGTRAYKIICCKYTSAMELLGSVKKVISSHISEKDLARRDVNE